MMGYGWGMGAGGWIAMVVFWVALVTLAVWVIARVLPSGREARHEGVHAIETPEQILDRRFASGELDLETYREMRTTLAQSRSSGQGGAR